MALSCEEHLNILRGRVEDWGKVCGSHSDGLDISSGRDIDVRHTRKSREVLFASGHKFVDFDIRLCGTAVFAK